MEVGQKVRISKNHQRFPGKEGVIAERHNPMYPLSFHLPTYLVDIPGIGKVVFSEKWLQEIK